jgi:hypothetical protein
MDIQLANLERLLAEKLYGGAARDALICLQTRPSILHFIDQGGSGRDADSAPFYALADFYSTCEIAALLGVIPAKLPRRFSEDTKRVLRNRGFKRLYQDIRPNLVVEMFRLRAEGDNQLTVPTERGTSAFVQLVELTQMAEEVERMRSEDAFQLSLKTIGRHSPDANEDRLRTVEEFAVRLRMSGDFWIGLRSYIEDEQTEPLVRSATWHHFTPTITRGREFTSRVLREITVAAGRNRGEWAESVDRALDALGRMEYSGPLVHARDTMLLEKPHLMRAEVVDSLAESEFQRVISESWAQLEPPKNREDIRSLSNALEAAQVLGARIGYAEIIGRLSQEWNKWMRAPLEQRRGARTTAEWSANLQSQRLGS